MTLSTCFRSNRPVCAQEFTGWCMHGRKYGHDYPGHMCERDGDIKPTMSSILPVTDELTDSLSKYRLGTYIEMFQ